MITPKIGFITYGVHKDGLEDPMGTPFVDDALVASSKKSLRDAGLELVERVREVRADIPGCCNRPIR